MSYSMKGFCIKIADLRAAIDNITPELLEELRQRYPREFVPGDEDFGPSAGEVLTALLEKKGLSEFDEGGAVEALELLSRHLGKSIDGGKFDCVNLFFIYEAFGGGPPGGVIERLATHRPPVPIPACDDGLPWTSYLTLEEIQSVLAAMESSEDDDDEQLASEKLEARDELRHWLYTALDNQTDLVVFVH